jgi:carbamoyl-phosphate synthase large subunit
VTATAARPNVLITSAARKVLLVRAFRDALARVGGGGTVVAADLNPQAAALYAADSARLLPRSDDPSFVDTLLALCAEERIGLVVPTRDEELPLLASVRDRFATDGTVVLVSAPGAVEACRDKVRFIAAVAAAGLATPARYDRATVAYPAFVKPRWGKGARGATRVDDDAELVAALQAIEALGDEPIIQAFVEAPEFTIDVFIDLDGRPISCVPRERVSVLSGESVVGRTVRDAELCEASIRLCTAIGLIGHQTVQAFRTPESISFIEINPRYGGAANLGFVAGAPTPEYAIRATRGERLEPRLGAYEAGLVMLRYSDDLFVHEGDLLGGGG